MKLSALFEMPDYIDKEISFNDKLGQHYYSSSTVKREFKILTADEIDDRLYMFAYSENLNLAVILLEAARPDGSVGYQIIGQLDFKGSPDVSWERDVKFKNHILQVDGVEVYDKGKFKGLCSKLYRSLAYSGFNIISDNTQYRGGKALWIKLAKESALKRLNVYVIENGYLMRDALSIPIKYDSINIEDHHLWAEPTKTPEGSKKFTLFVLTSETLV